MTGWSGRLAIAIVLAGLTSAVAATAGAEPISRDRFDPRAARLRVEALLARQAPLPVVQLEHSTPYLPPATVDSSVDARIRRLGELIRQQQK